MRHPFRVTAAVSVILLTMTSSSALPSLTAAAATCSGLSGDVDGDGHAEVAIGEPGDSARRGGVHIVYGTGDGLTGVPGGTARDDQWFVKGAGGVPGTAADHDDFGRTVELGDFNGDGCADLAAAAPGARALAENPAQPGPPGNVTVLYGSPQGLTTVGAQSFSLASVFPDGPAASEARFGAALTVSDLNGDGVVDLAVGAPWATPGATPDTSLVRAGAVAVLFGSTAGLDRGPTRSSLITKASDGVPGAVDRYEVFGSALTSGDFDADGRSELVIGAPGHSQGRHAFAGAVYVVGGLSGGRGPVRATMVDQASPGVPGSNETEDRFGSALAAGDVTGDGHDDVVVGVPFEDHRTGAVVLLKGSRQGLSGRGAEVWTQASRGVGGSPARNDLFGYAVGIARFDADGRADVAVGTPADRVGSRYEVGSVTVLRGSAGGLTTRGTGGTRLTPGTAGIAGAAREGSGFGAAVAAAEVQGVGQANLVIGSPGGLTGTRFGGLVYQLGRGPSGPVAATSRALGQQLSSVQGTAADGDVFGWAVA